MAPHRHLVVDVTVTSARTNTNVPRIGARLPLHGSLALGAQHGKLNADLRTYTVLGTPSVRYMTTIPSLLRMGAGWRRWRLSWLITLAIFVDIPRSPSMCDAGSRSLRYDSYVSYRMHHFVRRSISVPFRRFLTDVRREFMQRLSDALHGTLGSYLRDAF
jgi:hypothetical protein